MPAKPRYQRVVVKISGEAFCQAGAGGIDADAMDAMVAEFADAAGTGAQLAVVVGGGNFVRGRGLVDNPHIRRTTADYMGMLATTINALALRDAFEARGLDAHVLGALAIETLIDPVDVRRAVGYLQAGKILILAGGTGRPFVTTDTCAALRACELQAQAVFKATKVDGVYDRDPAVDSGARRFKTLTYQQVIADQLGVMDLTAISMCRENHIPIVVFQLLKKGSLTAALCGQDVGTVITD